jgi:hypothetical protein
LGHPGVNNGFLVEVADPLALKYNDRSPLENMHCARLYNIVNFADSNIFLNFKRDQYKVARKTILEAILHTDMVLHGSMVKELQMTYQMNSDVFRAPAKNRGSNADGRRGVLSVPETKTLVINAILHSADVSNPCRTFPVTQAWAMRCIDEFFTQGDKEKSLGIPVQFLNDRHKLNKPNSQIGFIEFMIAPFFVSLIKLWPGLQELGDNLSANIQRWHVIWEAEVKPTTEESSKVKDRVTRVQSELEVPNSKRTRAMTATRSEKSTVRSKHLD